MGIPILEIANVTKSFKGWRAVCGASFDVGRGSITALIGPNGAGKTTMFDMIAGFSRPDSGQIRLARHNITGLPPHRIARRGLVRSFQFPRVLAGMTVLENVLLAAPRQTGEHLLSMLARPRLARDREALAHIAAKEFLRLFGLNAWSDEFAGTLSGGQRRLLGMAQVLMTEPEIVLLDEPLTGIGPGLAADIFDIIASARQQSMTTFLFIEHNLDVVMRRADEIVVMVEGRVIGAGTPEAITSNSQVIDAYMGDMRKWDFQ
ncbi:hypothetical protein ASC90_17305 [Rhizobium sp. Root1220]|nr:hypothetical protein ASC90_17305 [Rhizobium sp. Root1220]